MNKQYRTKRITLCQLTYLYHIMFVSPVLVMSVRVNAAWLPLLTKAKCAHWRHLIEGKE